MEYLEATDDVDYEELEYFRDAKVLRDAAYNYYADSLEYETYRENELEKQVEKYADEELEYLRQKLGWKEESLT